MQLIRSDIAPRFIDLFTKQLGLSQAELDDLLDKFHAEHVPKRAFYLKAGDVSTHKAYMNRGCARSYTLDEKGKEHVLFFGFEDWWLADYESYTTRRPGKQYVQAIEDLELLCISRDDFDLLSERIPALKKWYEVKQQKMVFSMIDRLIEVKMRSPEERLVKLAKSRPDIFQRIAMQDIASYLDIEPQSLSRIRKRMLENERNV